MPLRRLGTGNPVEALIRQVPFNPSKHVPANLRGQSRRNLPILPLSSKRTFLLTHLADRKRAFLHVWQTMLLRRLFAVLLTWLA